MRYTREDGCRAWLTYGLLRAETAQNLLEEYGSAEAVYDRFIKTGGRFLKQHHVSDTSIAYLAEHAEPDAMHEMMLVMKKLDIGILTQADLRYPDSLRDIPSPPALLFYRGDPDCLMGKCATIVGSRTCSPQGYEVTRKISRELSAAGVVIVSGLAMGIDTAAHEGCIDGGSPTAAVLACGMDIEYPAENVGLVQEILKTGGVLLSEYPFGYRANKHVFAVRNRIMSGLGRIVLMMECSIKSGSMLTVQHALDQGKDVYAYPGMPGTEWAEGAHQLLREGAVYFTSADDILEDMGWKAAEVKTAKVSTAPALPPMSEEQRKVYSLICSGEITFDELAAASDLSAAALSSALTMLQIMGLINANPGKSYSKA